jgi:hypothetical protein
LLTQSVQFMVRRSPHCSLHLLRLPTHEELQLGDRGREDGRRGGGCGDVAVSVSLDLIEELRQSVEHSAVEEEELMTNKHSEHAAHILQPSAHIKQGMRRAQVNDDHAQCCVLWTVWLSCGPSL